MSALRLCPGGKFAWVLREDAEAALARQREVPDAWHRKGHRPIRAYRCLSCGWWHLTGEPDWGRYHLAFRRPPCARGRA
jgi:hypothetical protein